MDKNRSDRLRFAQLVPFYCNKTLDESDRVWMDAYIEQNPEVEKQLAFEGLMRETALRVKSAAPEEERFAKLMLLVEQSRSRRSWLQRLSKRAADILLYPRIAIPTTALAGLLLVIVGQTVFTLQGTSDEPDTGVFRGGNASCIQEPRLRIVFNPDARHAEVLLLLRKAEATFIAGPSESGEVWIAVPPSRSIEVAQALLRASPLVDEVVLAPALIGAPGCRP